MKKIILFLLFIGSFYAQSLNNRSSDYYGNGKKYSDSLQVTVGDSISGEYYIQDVLVMLAVDSNWTASGVVPLVYNDLEGTYEPLYKSDGSTLVEWSVAVGKPVRLDPMETRGLKRVKFAKMTSGSYVTEATAAGNIIVITVRE